MPLILDTDIGDDIDDALALALILNSPELDLRGITTVFVDAARRAQLAQKVLSAWNRSDVPVAAGCSLPLLEPVTAHAGKQFQDVREEEIHLPHGVDFLVQSVEEKWTIVAIGPLTNVALALAREPHLAENTRLVIMGGQGTRGDSPEWNIRCDPEAAAMVFRSGIEIWQVGYDITSQVQLSEAHLTRIASENNPRVKLLAQLIELWRDGRKCVPLLHDPLAVLALITDCVQFEERETYVKLCGDGRGMCVYSTPQPSRVHVAVAVDAPCAIDIFMQRILHPDDP
jgi:inosine-uridine nucleoside N-ribohydrolase